MPLRGEAQRKTYTIQAAIANGVWIAHHAILGENCVQKAYAPAGREDAIAFAEPRLLNELDHPHITPLREAQFDPDRHGHVTIVMRVYEGGSIYDALAADYRFSIGYVIALLQDVADALPYRSGRWPPRRRPDDHIELLLTSTVLRSGANRGRRRLTALYRSATSAGWRDLSSLT